jgi:hypothetical protein
MIYGDEALQPDPAIDAEAQGLMRIGMSAQSARNVARASKLRDLAAEAEPWKVAEAEERAQRSGNAETAYFMAARSGLTRSFAEVVADAAASMDQADLMAAAREVRSPADRPGWSTPVPSRPAPESPASKRARLAARAQQILGPRREKDTLDGYRRYRGTVDPGRHISVR